MRKTSPTWQMPAVPLNGQLLMIRIGLEPGRALRGYARPVAESGYERGISVRVTRPSEGEPASEGTCDDVAPASGLETGCHRGAMQETAVIGATCCSNGCGPRLAIRVNVGVAPRPEGHATGEEDARGFETRHPSMAMISRAHSLSPPLFVSTRSAPVSYTHLTLPTICSV